LGGGGWCGLWAERAEAAAAAARLLARRRLLARDPWLRDALLGGLRCHW